MSRIKAGAAVILCPFMRWLSNTSDMKRISGMLCLLRLNWLWWDLIIHTTYDIVWQFWEVLDKIVNVFFSSTGLLSV